MVGYGVMSLLMTATPFAMSHHHHPYPDAAFVIEWHVIGMFTPAFFTGSLVRRFGVLAVMLAGAALMMACVAIAISGVALPNFWTALVLLGIGWNFLYVGGTTLLTECYTPAESQDPGVNVHHHGHVVEFGVGGARAGVMNFWALPSRSRRHCVVDGARGDPRGVKFENFLSRHLPGREKGQPAANHPVLAQLHGRHCKPKGCAGSCAPPPPH